MGPAHSNPGLCTRMLSGAGSHACWGTLCPPSWVSRSRAARHTCDGSHEVATSGHSHKPCFLVENPVCERGTHGRTALLNIASCWPCVQEKPHYQDPVSLSLHHPLPAGHLQPPASGPLLNMGRTIPSLPLRHQAMSK